MDEKTLTSGAEARVFLAVYAGAKAPLYHESFWAIANVRIGNSIGLGYAARFH